MLKNPGEVRKDLFAFKPCSLTWLTAEGYTQPCRDQRLRVKLQDPWGDPCCPHPSTPLLSDMWQHWAEGSARRPLTFEPERQISWHLFICEDYSQADLCPEPCCTFPGGPSNTGSLPGETARTPVCKMAHEGDPAPHRQSPGITQPRFGQGMFPITA